VTPDVEPDADGGHRVDDEILDAVAESQELLPREKETTIWFKKHDDRAVVHTDEAGLARRLLAHPRASLRSANVRHDRGARTVEAVEALRGLDDDARVTSVIVDVPVPVVLIQLYPRDTDQHAHVVTKRVFRDDGRADE
jgi:hypothetical protein